jgi:hypothetical protein
MASKPVILEGGDPAGGRVQWLSSHIADDPENRRIERTRHGYELAAFADVQIEVYVFSGDREPVTESWNTRAGNLKQRVHQAPVFVFDHIRTFKS